MKRLKKSKYAMGGTGSGLLQHAPELLDGLMGLLEGQKDYSSQPIVNAQAIKNMATPYSFGFGGVGGDDDNKPSRKVRRLASKTNTRSNYGFNGIVADDGSLVDNPSQLDAIHTMVQYMQNNTPNSNTYRLEDTHTLTQPDVLNLVNPKPTLKTVPLIPTTAAYGGSIEDLDEDELADLQSKAEEQGVSVEDMFDQISQQQSGVEDEEYEDVNVPDDEEGEAFAYGGKSIEVEGNEIVQTPNGRAKKMRGPSHEEGGIDINVPQGTKIYSDRLAIDGKTMQQRKASRMRRMKNIGKSLEVNPLDPLSKNTLERTTETAGMEEKQDMALQNFANRIYAAPRKRGMGGVAEDKYAFGGNNDLDWLDDEEVGVDPRIGSKAALPFTPNDNVSLTPRLPFTPSQTASALPVDHNENSDSPFTVGDYVGMAGGVFNSIAPLINTRNAARATKPVRNRYQGFGQDALNSNDFAMSELGAQEASDNMDLNTSTNTAYARNRNSTGNINTLRALDAVTNMATNKARVGLASGKSGRRIALLGQRAQLQNQRDATVARGATAADQENAANTDNYYTNMAANLTNLGTNVEGIAKNLNISQRNQDDMDLLGAMTQNGVRFKRKKGRLTLSNNQ